MKRLALSLAFGLLLTSCSSSGGVKPPSSESSSPTPSTHTLTISASGPCEINGGWNASGVREDVQVRDPNDKLIGAATMDVTGDNFHAGMCIGTVIIRDVPTVALYQVKIGTVPGIVTFQESDLERNGWQANVTIQ